MSACDFQICTAPPPAVNNDRLKGEKWTNFTPTVLLWDLVVALERMMECDCEFRPITSYMIHETLMNEPVASPSWLHSARHLLLTQPMGPTFVCLC